MFVLILEAIVLGILQGATEFIPISSSAHLIIVPWLFNWTDPALTSLSFDVALHLGTLLAVLIFFFGDLVSLVIAGWQSIKERKIGDDSQRRLAWFIVIGTIPGGIIGFLAETKIESLFHTPGQPVRPEAMIAMALIIAWLGGFLWLADRLARHVGDLKDLTLKKVLYIGFAQALAVFPGVSRSGSTITTGLALGMKREAAARFSFLLSIPIIAGTGLKSLLDIYQGFKAGAITHQDLLLFPIGFIFAAIAGYFCVRFLLNYLQKHTVSIFVYYRFALALLVLLVAMIRMAAGG
jgi:undecaprenyl-diphosphatase